jgi:hypothetical protein
MEPWESLPNAYDEFYKENLSPAVKKRTVVWLGLSVSQTNSSPNPKNMIKKITIDPSGLMADKTENNVYKHKIIVNSSIHLWKFP